MEKYEIEKKWASHELYLDTINSSLNMKELLGSPFLLKMFVEAMPFMDAGSAFGVLDIYVKFEEHSFDRELQKQATYVNEMKYTVKDTKEYLIYALEVASKMM